MSVSRRILWLFFVGTFLLLVSAANVLSVTTVHAASQMISPTSPTIKYVGRWDTSSSTVYTSYWPGAYFETQFTGTTVAIHLASSVNIYVSIDHGADTLYSAAQGTVNLTPTPLAAGTHLLRVAARTDFDYIPFQGLVLDAGATTSAPTLSSKLIEFIGDSITAGYTDSKYALSDYAWLIGEQLGVQHTQVAQSGICLVDAIQCYSPNPIGMSKQFFKLQNPSFPTSPNWDFSRYQASAVVVNLGTNDTSFNVADATFQSTYETFLHNIRNVYPAARIFALETFLGEKAAPTQAAVQAAGDSNVQYVDTTGWVSSSDTNDGTHPSDAGHAKIAGLLGPILGAYLGLNPPPTPTPVPVVHCSVHYAIANQWTGGFGASITITNTGTTAINGWSLGFSFPNGQTIAQGWNGVFTQSGSAVMITNAAWNGLIPAGAALSSSPGFNGSSTGTNGAPTAFTLNGTTCTVS